MAVKPETVAALKKLLALSDKIKKARDKVDKDMEEIKRKIAEATAKRQRSTLETYKAKLAALIDQTEATQLDIGKARIELEKINRDTEFVDQQLAKFDPAIQIVDDADEDLPKRFQEAKRLENAIEKAVAATFGGEKQDLRDLQNLDRWIKDQRKELKQLYDKSEQLNTAATGALEARNQKALADAQAKMKVVGADLDVAAMMRDGFIKQLDEMDKRAAGNQVSADVAGDLKDGVADLRAAIAGSNVSLEYGLKNRDRVLAMEIIQLDVSKALKVLELDPKYKSKLAEALSASSKDRAGRLGQLAKAAKLDMKGDEMEDKLVKERVIPRP